ncbi:MAG: ABC transporter permease [Bacteroidales bacterium]|nr:ABC transporter permease [Bacteroidales bacterium]MDD4217396.1 ABC transporter permease [Bacteroidales bacterium]
MNGTTQDISLINLIIGFTVIIIPITIFLYYRVRMVKDLIISSLRMVVQLSLVAIYLEWIFKLNNAWLNSAWVIIMVLISAGTSVKRIKVSARTFFIPFSLSVLFALVIIDGFFLGLVIRLDYIFDARYFIPISGMILGNSLNHNIVGLSSYFDSFKQRKELYYFVLTNSGSQKLAIRPFIQEALVKGLNPLLAGMSVMGLISLPGMMTGQILGGASPATAIKYQIMIMIAIFAGCVLSLMLSLWYANLKIFDKYGNVKEM